MKNTMDSLTSQSLLLTSVEDAMLNGEQGPAIQNAIRFQIEVGKFFGAERFVKVTNAHFMGDFEVMGDGGLEYLRRLSHQNARCAVPTSRNASCMHFDAAECLHQDSSAHEKERELVRHLRRMNMATTDTCINYQTIYQPKFGEHVAWGDTGTVIYANSVLGARTNYEGGYASLAASLTGRTPAYGFHLDSVRRGSIAVNLKARAVDLAEWGAIGKIIGHPNQNYFSVPVISGVDDVPSSDALKHLGASLASYGSMAMFHMVGVTPEARTAGAAFSGNKPKVTLEITDGDIDAVFRSYSYVEGEPTIVVFSGPQLSLFEMQHLAHLFRGRRVVPEIQAFATTNHAVYADASRLGYVDLLEAAGVTILKGVCFYILQDLSQIRERNNWTNLVSNSAKLVNTITAHRFNTVLRRTEDCVNIACTGRLK